MLVISFIRNLNPHLVSKRDRALRFTHGLAIKRKFDTVMIIIIRKIKFIKIKIEKIQFVLSQEEVCTFN